jgi:hypothetical protein
VNQQEAKSEQAENKGQISDGYHTFDELYAHRIALWIALCWKTAATIREAWNPVWRTKLHSDASSFGGWFVLGMFTEPGFQITYHLPNSEWDRCDFARTLERAPEFDGHTPADCLERIKKISWKTADRTSERSR